MTNDELKALCLAHLEEFPIETESAEEYKKIPKAVLRLLAQCEAMRGVVEAARNFYNSDYVHVEEHWERDGRTRIVIPAEEALKKALSQLGERT